MDTDRNKTVSVGVEGGCKVADNLIAHVVCKATLFRLFVGGHELVYYACKVVYDYTLDFCFAFNCIESATYGCRSSVTGARTTT